MQLNTKQQTNYEKEVHALFSKQNPLSLNNKSIYLQDYKSICDHNWLRTQIISSLITIMEKSFQQKMQQIFGKFQSNQKKYQEKKQQEKIENVDSESKKIKLSEEYARYVKIVDPFIVTMILFTHQDFILQTLQGLQIFNKRTKYIVFPMNSQIQKGSHWFLTIFKNPRFEMFSLEQAIQQTQGKKIFDKNNQQPQLFVLNSISSPKNDSSLYMSNQLSQQICKLMKLFHPQEKQLKKIPVTLISNRSLQQNSYDCGIFTVAYIEQLLFNKIIGTQMQEIVNYRLWQKQSIKNIKVQSLSRLTEKSQFTLIKSSSYLRRFYKKVLEEQIFLQNKDKI